MNTRIASSRGYGLLFIIALLSLVPLVSRADGIPGADTGSDMQCIPVIPVCGCNQIMTQKGCQRGANEFMCPCQQTDNGFTTSGMCLADQKCHAMSTGGKSPDQGLSQLGQMLSQLMQQLMKGGGGGGGGSGSGSGSGSQPCTSYSQTSDPSRVGVDPCSYYVPSAASQISTNITGTATGSSANDLLSALGGSGSLLTTGSIGTPTGGSASSTQGGNPTPAPSAAVSQQILNNIGSLAPASNQSQKAGFSNIPGVVGNILFSNGGATIFASTVNSANNSSLSGFYGSDTGLRPQGAVTGMCQNRPWASNFLANIIPASFFDGLCQWGGYQVGKPAAQPQVMLTQTPATPAKTQTPAPAATSSTPAVQPIVQIWAVPATVPLGTRTSIFWRTQGVTNCTETSPDGSFSQNTLQGAGATVPITGATTFTISCIDSTGKPVTSYVTVNLQI